MTLSVTVFSSFNSTCNFVRYDYHSFQWESCSPWYILLLFRITHILALYDYKWQCVMGASLQLWCSQISYIVKVAHLLREFELAFNPFVQALAITRIVSFYLLCRQWLVRFLHACQSHFHIWLSYSFFDSFYYCYCKFIDLYFPFFIFFFCFCSRYFI